MQNKMENQTHCPNCNTKLKSMLTTINFSNENVLKFAKDFGGFNGDILCDKCSKEYINKGKEKYISESRDLKKFLKSYCSTFPIVTTQNPQDWKYDTIEIVTAQATMNNKVENKSFLDNLFGVNQNIVDLDGSVNIGESICFNILRQKAYLLGGNAILGVDIDYSEFGLKGELMLVCMAGTAIKLQNLELLSNRYSKYKIKYDELEDRFKLIKEHSNLDILK